MPGADLAPERMRERLERWVSELSEETRGLDTLIQVGTPTQKNTARQKLARYTDLLEVLRVAQETTGEIERLREALVAVAIAAEALLLVEERDPRHSRELREGLHQGVQAARAALEYVARLCRARDALVSRRVATALGSSRANGLLGALLSALALAATWNVLRSWAPTLPGWIFVLLFGASFWLVLYVAVGILGGGHGTSRLLWYADAIDATLRLQEAGADLEPPPPPVQAPDMRQRVASWD